MSRANKVLVLCRYLLRQMARGLFVHQAQTQETGTNIHCVIRHLTPARSLVMFKCWSDVSDVRIILQ